MTHVPDIIPAILALTKQEALDRWQSAVEVPWIQIDCLDGRFLPNTSFYQASEWPTQGPFIELHLMCEHPLEVLQQWEHHPLLKRAIWHQEAPVPHEQLIEWCRKRDLACGIALNPETSLSTIFSLTSKIDTLLLLGVHPGWSGQPFVPTTFEKLRLTRELYPDLEIGVDGGVNEERIPRLAELGADHLYTASALFSDTARTPAHAWQHLTHLAQTPL